MRSLRSILGAATPGRVIALATGTYDWNDFGSNLTGLDASASTAGFQGAGVDRTVLQMAPRTSTKAGSVPKALGTTNQLSLMRVTGSPVLSDFTLRGTDQGHLYNGLRVHQTADAKVTDVKVTSVPGDFDSPPGETFGINDFRTHGSVYRDVEVDGAKVGGAGFGTNNSSDVTVSGSSFHDSGYSHGATFWQTRNVTVEDTSATNNFRAGFNFERVTGDVRLQGTTTRGNKLADIRIGNDQGSAKYTIVDPHYSGSKLRIMLTPTYMGRANLQKRSDIRVIVNGVDRTDQVVEWVTHW